MNIVYFLQGNLYQKHELIKIYIFLTISINLSAFFLKFLLRLLLCFFGLSLSMNSFYLSFFLGSFFLSKEGKSPIKNKGYNVQILSHNDV